MSYSIGGFRLTASAEPHEMATEVSSEKSPGGHRRSRVRFAPNAGFLLYIKKKI